MMFFDNWYSLLRIVVVGVCAYVVLVLFLRASGKRTLSKLNAFDLIVTVAMGSTLATVLLSKDVALADGVVAFALLIVMQFVVAWLSVRWHAFGRMVKSEPRLLFLHGTFLRDAMRAERVTEEEVLAAVREQNFPTLDAVEAVVLETAGTFSVLRRSDGAGQSTLPHTASSQTLTP